MMREQFPNHSEPERMDDNPQESDELIEKADHMGDELVEKIEAIGSKWPQNKEGKKNKKEKIGKESEPKALAPDEADTYFEQLGSMSEQEVKEELGIPEKENDELKNPKPKKRF